MPELPEVEAFKKYITLHCLHKKIKEVEITDKRVIKTNPAQFIKELEKQSFSQVERKGKFVIITLAPSDEKLVMHFALTGSLFYSKKKNSPDRFSAVAFLFQDNAILHFNSVRKFEKLWLLDDSNKIKELKHLGPDALKLSEKEFLALAQKSKSKNIKAFLTDQSIMAGIGNEYSDEILFQAGVDPHHQVGDLLSATLKRIYKELRSVLLYSTKLRIKNLKLMGSHYFSKADRTLFKASYLQAHRHIDMLCPKHKNHRLKITKIAGRTTYYCPVDQK